MPVDLTDLEDLTMPALAARLMAIARDLPRARREEDASALASYRSALARIVAKAREPQLSLLEVVFAMFRHGVPESRPEQSSLRTVLHDTAGAEIFERLIREVPVDVRAADSLSADARAAFQDLERLGVVQRVQDHFVIARSYRAAVRDAVEPLAFRLWRQVQHARLQASWKRTPAEQIAVIAGLTGVSTAQASFHLVDVPLAVSGSTISETHVRWRRAERLSPRSELDESQRPDVPLEREERANVSVARAVATPVSQPRLSNPELSVQ